MDLWENDLKMFRRNIKAKNNKVIHVKLIDMFSLDNGP